MQFILRSCCTPYRKGPAVSEQVMDGVAVTVLTVFDMPPVPAEVPEHVRLVDCHFLVIGVDLECAELARTEFLHLLAAFPPRARLSEGPSFITVAPEIGGQEAAFAMFALGEALGLWKVMTPARLGVPDGPLADQMAGSGCVMMTGLPARAAA